MTNHFPNKPARCKSGVARNLWCLAAAAFFPLLVSAEPHTTKLLADIFSNNAVLLSEAPVRLWGTGSPEDKITVSIAEQIHDAIVDESGHWSIDLLPVPAGGPHTLIAISESGEEQKIENIKFGEVWLCAGQSNMEWTVAKSAGGSRAIRDSYDDELRFLHIDHTSKSSKSDRLPSNVKWKLAGPSSTGEFSAACFFMGQELRKKTGRPVGLIAASWGGSALRSWMPGRDLREAGGFEEYLDILALHSTNTRQAEKKWQLLESRWWSIHDPGVSSSMPWYQVEYPITKWQEIAVPGNWENTGIAELNQFDGIVWFRRSFSLNNHLTSNESEISLGPIDDADTVWVNGFFVGSTHGWSTDRIYRIPRGVLKEGANTISVRVLDKGSSGGFRGDENDLYLRVGESTRIPLSGTWHYKVAAPLSKVGKVPDAPWSGPAGVSTLFNGMIAPLLNYNLRGVAWYQGETDRFNPLEYARLFPSFIRAWRREFGRTLPFVVVQLAGYGNLTETPTYSPLAEVREVQRVTANENEGVALVTAIDIGNRFDIHPTNKKELGRRMMLAALHLVYGRDVTSSGPRPNVAERSGDSIIVSFKNTNSKLRVVGSHRPVGFQLCRGQYECRFVDADLENNSVRIDIPGNVDPNAVRYCWADYPLCNLTDESGLPAIPFQLTID
ncbi:MAG: sialate O-acetylesterase [Xanthomonadales bacterium]|nr:sialate O-acetylesterase [Xanthomonadales bacterium]